MRPRVPLGAILLALAVTAPTAQATDRDVIPFPGTPDASPSTQIIFSSVRPGQLSSVTVTGSLSGRHAGRLFRLPAEAGTAFVPGHPFRAGERVTVRGLLALGAAGSAPDPERRFRFSFGVARPVMKLMHAGRLSGASSVGERPALGPALSFHSEPGLRPPAFTVSVDPDHSSGDMFLTPTGGSQPGPMILDAQGRLVWFHPLRHDQALNLQVQRYRGRPVLTWFRGTIFGGQNVIMDRSYRRLAVVRAGNGYTADLHEFQITRRGTALLDAYVPVHHDLRSVGGKADGTVFDCVIQEVDIRTGQVLWEWHSLGHIPLSASYQTTPNPLDIVDYFHLNSIQELAGGNLLISARNTWAIYEISRRTGRVIWTLGGRRSGFRMGPGTNFEWQHDARLDGNGILTLFDDGATPAEERQSSAKALRINTRTMTVSLVHRYTHSPLVLSGYGGSAQVLPNHDVFVTWGSEPEFSEYSPQGKQIFDGSFPLGVGSYRAFRFPWHARPLTRPRLAIMPRAGGRLTIYASWNGATQVAAWRVLSGPRPDSLRPLIRARRTGFETAIALNIRRTYFAVQALDFRGRVLGTSAARAR